MADTSKEDIRKWMKDLLRFRMTYTMKRWYRTRRNQIIIIALILTILVYFTEYNENIIMEMDLEATRRHIEKRLEEGLKLDKGSGCEIPQIDPFSKEIMQFHRDVPPVHCSGIDWVKCWLSECKIVPEVLKTTTDITCTYHDIIYESDVMHHLGSPTEVKNDDTYTLVKSDHAKVVCTGKRKKLFKKKWMKFKWKGHVAGFRNSVDHKTSPQGREKTYNVLIFGFDSTSRNGFIRKMPYSYKYLTEELHATVLKGYNIVGDGTAATVFPILTGKTLLELPDVRKMVVNPGTLEDLPFIFYKLNEDGYRTAFFEDSPSIGTFQYRFVGFRKQPTDHYVQPFYIEEYQSRSIWKSAEDYCVGATPRYRLMMNWTDQFFRLDGKRFCFTFISDISHNDFNVIGTADHATVQFLNTFKESGRLKDTVLLVMGDHGYRFGEVRGTLQGKFEERLPLMAIVLPEDLKRKRPTAQKNLELNVNVLTTPHDIHATLLDALDWRQHWNPYKVPGADLPRAISLLEQVPKNRSCSEAGIEPHWCSCLSWQNVTATNPLYQRVAQTLVNYLNKLTEKYRTLCAPRTLTSISWVMRQLPNKRLLTFVASKDVDGYVGNFGGGVDVDREVYEVKIVVGPGVGIFESSLIYYKKEDKLDLSYKDISRTNAYNDEPHCVSESYPHLNMYCYCFDKPPPAPAPVQKHKNKKKTPVPRPLVS